VQRCLAKYEAKRVDPGAMLLLHDAWSLLTAQVWHWVALAASILVALAGGTGGVDSTAWARGLGVCMLRWRSRYSKEQQSAQDAAVDGAASALGWGEGVMRWRSRYSKRQQSAQDAAIELGCSLCAGNGSLQGAVWQCGCSDARGC
jgi:hypothetical protein